MDREHKYKLWDKEEKKMYQCVTIACTNKNRWSPLIYTSDHIINGIDHDNYELLEYTGLKDNTKWDELTRDEQRRWMHGGNLSTEWCGKRIYEGYIVSLSGCKYDYAKVVWYDGKFELRINNNSVAWFLNKSNIWNHKIKIIGNIYQNPELLEK